MISAVSKWTGLGFGWALAWSLTFGTPEPDRATEIESRAPSEELEQLYAMRARSYQHLIDDPKCDLEIEWLAEIEERIDATR